MTRPTIAKTPPALERGNDVRPIDPAAVGQVPTLDQDIELSDGDLDVVAGAGTCEMFTPDPS